MPEHRPDLCVKVRDRIDKWNKYWTINRSLYYEWMDFILGDQWREDESKLFERYNKIPLVVNKLGVLANHLAGDQMQNTPNLQIQPSENVPAEVANVRAALIKHINLNSDAKDVYQTAFWQSIIGGYSAWAMNTKFRSDKSFDKDIDRMSFTDPNRCYWDLTAKHKCKVDGRYAGYLSRVSRDMFRDQYGEDIERQIGAVAVTEDSTMAFADDDSITQIDDFERKPEKAMIYKISFGERGTVIDSDEYKKLKREKINKKTYLLYQNEPVTVLDKREVMKYKVTHRQIAGDFILDETDFPSEWLPVIFLDQKSYYSKSGQQITRSFFKDAKDAQKYLNYLMTQSAYILKVSRFDQFMAPRKAVSNPDTQQMWRDPSVVRGALVYDETQSGAKPEQLRPPELSASLSNEYQRTLSDIQTSTGMYNAQLGAEDEQASGKATDARTQRGTKNTYVPFNSLNYAIATDGEITNQMIPNVYDTHQQLVLPMPESEAQKVEINKPLDPYGMMIQNDMTTGEYDIRLKPGPSYEGEKDLARQSLQSIIENDRTGQAFTLLADLYAENLPLDNNIEIRNRLRTIVPPEVIEAGKTGKSLPKKQDQPSPEQIQAQLQQAALKLQEKEAQMEFNFKMKELKLKEGELQLKSLQTHQDMTMELEKLEVDREKAAAELQETILRYRGEQERINADMEMQHSDHLVNLITHHMTLKNKEGIANARSKSTA